MSTDNEGLQLLLNRLNSNPEDFEGIGEIEEIGYHKNRWAQLIHEVMTSSWFSKDEKDLLNHELMEMRRNNFTRKVLVTLTDDAVQLNLGQKQLRNKSPFGMVP